MLSIKYKWMILLIIFSILPLTVLGIVSYSISKTAIDHKTMEYSKQLMRQTAENIDIRLSAYEDILIQIITNPDIIKILKQVNKAEPEQRAVSDLLLSTKLAYFTSVSQEFKSVSFISKKHYIRGIYWWTDDAGDADSRFFADTMRAGNSFIWFPTRIGHFSASADHHSENVFALAKQMFDINDGSPMGMVAVIDIREEMLKEICKKSGNGDLSVESFIVDKDGTIISHPDNDRLYHNLREFFEPRDVQTILRQDSNEASLKATYLGQKVLINYLKLSGNDWRLVNVIDQNSLYKDSRQVIDFITVIALLCLALSIPTAYLIAQTISNPIKRMVKAMRSVVSGNLSVRIRETGGQFARDEITVLQNSFNYMVSRLKDLIDQVYEEQNQKRNAEIMALEAQINPHFLYNTLDTIKWTALFHKANNVAEMTSMLSRLLHISLGKGRDLITVEEEIEHVKCYIGIQKFRYNFNIDFRIRIGEEVKSAKIPKIILQPIVENAILHGFKDRQEGNAIDIACTMADGKLKFEVSDNGSGMNPDEIDSFKNSRRKSGEPFTGIGLKNIDERIKLICGQEYGIEISSRPNAGTTVVIWLPATLS
jgi:two-component system sensor histidine kinase YesM